MQLGIAKLPNRPDSVLGVKFENEQNQRLLIQNLYHLAGVFDHAVRGGEKAAPTNWANPLVRQVAESYLAHLKLAEDKAAAAEERAAQGFKYIEENAGESWKNRWPKPPRTDAAAPQPVKTGLEAVRSDLRESRNHLQAASELGQVLRGVNSKRPDPQELKELLDRHSIEISPEIKASVRSAGRDGFQMRMLEAREQQREKLVGWQVSESGGLAKAAEQLSMIHGQWVRIMEDRSGMEKSSGVGNVAAMAAGNRQVLERARQQRFSSDLDNAVALGDAMERRLRSGIPLTKADLELFNSFLGKSRFDPVHGEFYSDAVISPIDAAEGREFRRTARQ
jgi:hypothetical protein